MNQPQEKSTNQILSEGLNQVQISTLKMVITLLEKYPVEMVINGLRDQVKELEDRALAREQDHE